MNSSFNFRPEIEGLRCLAVLGVIAFHAQKFLLPGGYLGVDVFFVISGFLITSIILRERENGTFSLVKFWERRIKRIFPAATFVLLTVSLVQSFIIYHPDLLQLPDQKLSALLSFANIYFWRNTGDYWGSASEEFPFLHYWSLSVEEQYYLLYPILVMALLAKGRRPMFIGLVVLVLVSFVVFAFGTVYEPHATFYLLPTRMWQIGAGCLLAVSSDRMPVSIRSFGTLTGALLIGASYLFPSSTSSIGYDSFTVVVGTCLIIGSGSNTVSKAILENRAMTFIGRISFSLYLWHWPILVTLEKLRAYDAITSRVILVVVGGSALLALSLISYHFIEKKFRKHAYGTSIALGFATMVGVYVYFIEPWILSGPYSSKYEIPSWHGKYYDVKPRGELSQAFQLIANSVHAPERVASGTEYKTGGIIRPRSGPGVEVVLIGDSHAVMWSKVVDDVTLELDLTTSLWSMNGEGGIINIPAVEKAGSYLSKEERFEYDSARQHFIQEWHPDIVIVANCWDIIPESSLTGFFDFLELHAKHVIIVGSPPVLDIGNRSAYQYFSFLGMDEHIAADADQLLKLTTLENTANTRRSLLNMVSERRNFSYLPTADLFVSDSSAVVAHGKDVYYLDDDHLTDKGSQLAASRFRSMIRDIIGEQ